MIHGLADPPVNPRWLQWAREKRGKPVEETGLYCLPVVYGCPTPCAAPYSDGEHGEEEEEACHAKADFVDGRVADQSAAVLSSIQFFTNLGVVWNLKQKGTELLLERKHGNILHMKTTLYGEVNHALLKHNGRFKISHSYGNLLLWGKKLPNKLREKPGTAGLKCFNRFFAIKRKKKKSYYTQLI